MDLWTYRAIDVTAPLELSGFDVEAIDGVDRRDEHFERVGPRCTRGRSASTYQPCCLKDPAVRAETVATRLV